jgi:hypothetical protein
MHLPIKMDSSVSPKDEIWFLRVCHHISNAGYVSAEGHRKLPAYRNNLQVSGYQR